MLTKNALFDIAHRGAEAGGILGVKTSPPPPHFLEGLKNGRWRGSAAKIRGVKKF